MCLIAFAIDASPRWPFVLASNRDEFLERPTRPLARWMTASGQEIVSGRDGRAGGTWLGMTPSGRIAFLTNVREPQPKLGRSSRGELVTSWLESTNSAEEFLALLEASDAAYSGFNLVLGDIRSNAWTWLTNRSVLSATGWCAKVLPPGVYGLSNAALDTPWPKTLALKRALSLALTQAEESDMLRKLLWPALASRVQMPLAEFSKRGQSLESATDSAFVDIPAHAYGTRSSTVLLVNRKPDRSQKTRCSLEFHERSYLRESSGELTDNFVINFVEI